MSRYAERAIAPRTLTEGEVTRLLRGTGQRRGAYRDHVLVALALGTGLRSAELVALDVGDVFNGRGRARSRVVLRTFKRCTDEPEPQEVFVRSALRHKLDRFRRMKCRDGQSVAQDAPLFVARGGGRLSTRALRKLWGVWKERLDLPVSLTFHSLRHTFCQRVYDASGDPLLVKRLARHKRIATSSRYAVASDERCAAAVEGLW